MKSRRDDAKTGLRDAELIVLRLKDGVEHDELPLLMMSAETTVTSSGYEAVYGSGASGSSPSMM